MADRLNVDLAVLDAIADRLRRSGDALGATGQPATPSAGAATPLLDEILRAHSASAAGLGDGLRQASRQVSAAGRTYAETDTDSGRSLGGVF